MEANGLKSSQSHQSPPPVVTPVIVPTESCLVPGKGCYYTGDTSIPQDKQGAQSDASTPPQPQDKQGAQSDEDEDDYVNEGCVILRNSIACPSSLMRETSPVVVVVDPNIDTKSTPLVASPLSLGSKGAIDFGEGDFAFVDPKVLVTETAETRHVRSLSANNLNVYVQDRKPRDTVEQSGKSLLSHQKGSHLQRRSMGDFVTEKQAGADKDIYSYVNPSEVEWALARKITPRTSPRLSSSPDDSVKEEPLYENEMIASNS